MATRESYFDLVNRIEELRARLTDLQVAESPDSATQDALVRELADLQLVLTNALQHQPHPKDHGLANIVGIGDEAGIAAGEFHVNINVMPYDEVVTSERLLAMADLYYIYQHERAGVFRAVFKLQELFKAGRIRLADGLGAVGLYQYDRQRALRATRDDRMQAYRRAFGYTNTQPPAGARPNVQFHQLFTNFNTEAAQYFRDKRISEVVRPNGRDLTFGSVAVVRRAGLDLRANLKHASYGHVIVLATELSQLLERAFIILEADDVKRVFGADNAWDTLEEVLERYLGAGWAWRVARSSGGSRSRTFSRTATSNSRRCFARSANSARSGSPAPIRSAQAKPSRGRRACCRSGGWRDKAHSIGGGSSWQWRCGRRPRRGSLEPLNCLRGRAPTCRTTRGCRS
jgi:hypothetical protein